MKGVAGRDVKVKGVASRDVKVKGDDRVECRCGQRLHAAVGRSLAVKTHRPFDLPAHRGHQQLCHRGQEWRLESLSGGELAAVSAFGLWCTLSCGLTDGHLTLIGFCSVGVV